MARGTIPTLFFLSIEFWREIRGTLSERTFRSGATGAVYGNGFEDLLRGILTGGRGELEEVTCVVSWPLEDGECAEDPGSILRVGEVSCVYVCVCVCTWAFAASEATDDLDTYTYIHAHVCMHTLT